MTELLQDIFLDSEDTPKQNTNGRNNSPFCTPVKGSFTSSQDLIKGLNEQGKMFFFKTSMKSESHKFTTYEADVLNGYELKKETVFDVTTTETRESRKGSTKIPDEVVNTIGGIENMISKILKKSSHPKTIKIYCDELELTNTNM